MLEKRVLACMSVAQALTFPIEGYIRVDRPDEVTDRCFT